MSAMLNQFFIDFTNNFFNRNFRFSFSSHLIQGYICFTYKVDNLHNDRVCVFSML